MVYFITQSLHIPQTLLSAYGLYLSYTSITKLQKYEETSKKAAEWSNTAAEQLHKTRTTQASAALSIMFSFSTSLLLTLAPDAVPSLLRFTLSPALLICMLFARSHVADFWAHKAKVPGLTGFNDAISATVEILRVLRWLEWSWVGLSLVGAVVGY